jgi:hypothetical protein
MPVVTTAGLQALGPPPERPSQPQFTRAVRERQGHFQQPAHFGHGQFGQEGFRPPFFSVAWWRTEANQVWAIIESVI